MDFCGHGTLRQLFDKTFPEGWENGTLGLPLQLGECLCFIHQVADALDFAFRVYRTIHGEAKPAHIVHRDVKPSNILIDERDGRLCARLSDFGIAYLDDDAVRTRARGLMGSPLYAAPEQFFYPHYVGPAADQYALAVIVYQLLTGAVPFPERARPQAISSPETLRRTPVSLRNLAPDAGISLAVEEVVLKALNWYAEQRYSSVHDFVRALDQAHNDLGDDIASRCQKPTIMIRDESNIHNLPTVANELERSDGESVTIAWWDKARTDWERVKAKGLGPWDRALVGAAAAPLMGLLSMPFTYGLTFPFGHYWLSVVLAIATLFGVPWWLKWRF
jgi:serine/threonine protein kinase